MAIPSTATIPYAALHHIRRLVAAIRNGKIDRALALKIAEKSKSKTRNEPREGLEAAIALIFGEALSSSALDRKASIFELGGDSLSAAKISRAIQLKIARISHLEKYSTTHPLKESPPSFP